MLKAALHLNRRFSILVDMRSVFGVSVVLGFLCIFFSACATKEARLHDQAIIQSLLSEKGPEAEACYRQEAERNSELPSGSMKIRFDHDRQGRLARPRLMDGFSFSEPVYQCIVQKAKTWRTEQPATMGPVDLTFNFRNEGRRLIKDEVFGSYMQKHGDAFAECFLKVRPKAKRAQIDFKFRRTPDGKVEDLKQVRGFEGSEQIFSCMKNIISSWKLPPRDETLTADWTYKFDLEEPKSTTEQP